MRFLLVLTDRDIYTVLANEIYYAGEMLWPLEHVFFCGEHGPVWILPLALAAMEISTISLFLFEEKSEARRRRMRQRCRLQNLVVLIAKQI